MSYSTISTPNPALGRRLYTRTTDAAGKARLSRMDALGRLEAVIEDPDGAKLETQYQYDAQDNLVQVNQGVQVRKYFYDSLSRLTYSEQPEFVSDRAHPLQFRPVTWFTVIGNQDWA